MRVLLLIAVLLVSQTAAWAVGEFNTARPGGSFSTVAAEDAAACERLCRDDGLCLAWTYRANSCELKAIVPPAVVENGVVSGLSARAPSALRDRADPVPAQASGTEMPAELEAASASTAPEDDISAQLLGGLETEDGPRPGLDQQALR